MVRLFPSHRWVVALATALLLAPLEANASAPGPDLGASAGSGASTAAASGAGTIDYAGLVALDIPTSKHQGLGFRIAGEFMYGMGTIAPNLSWDLGGRLGLIYNSSSGLPPGESAWLLTFEAVPTARLLYALAPAFSAYGQGGIGLAFAHASATGGGTTNTDNSVIVVFHLGGGVMYALSPNLSVLGEIGFNFYTGDVGTTHIAIPTIGLQWRM